MTNATQMSVSEVVELYSLRWQIELFWLSAISVEGRPSVGRARLLPSRNRCEIWLGRSLALPRINTPRGEPLFFKELKSTLGFSQYRFQDFDAVRAWVDIAITTVLFLEHERAKRMSDRRLSVETRQWWQAQRLHGQCSAFRLECEGRELKYMADRLKTSGGIEKLKRLLTAALPKEYRSAG